MGDAWKFGTTPGPLPASTRAFWSQQMRRTLDTCEIVDVLSRRKPWRAWNTPRDQWYAQQLIDQSRKPRPDYNTLPPKP